MEEIKQKVFIVHGHDSKAKSETESLIYRLGMEPVILHRQANRGRTIIEKFEQESDVTFAIVLLTPDDKGGPKNSAEWFHRARQNVIFELGYLFGKLGREKVICIVKGDVEKPSDVDGIVYLQFKESAEEIESVLSNELKVTNKNAYIFLGGEEESQIALQAEAKSLAGQFIDYYKEFEDYNRTKGNIEPIEVYLNWASIYRRGYVGIAEDYDLFVAVAVKVSKMGFEIPLLKLNRKIFERTIKRAKLNEDSHRAEMRNLK